MMSPEGDGQLTATIAVHLREWEPSPPFVELAIFGTGDAQAIAGAIEAFCLEHLGAAAARGLFHQSSIGSVTGLVLDDGRAVVVKAHQPEQTAGFLAEVVRVQCWLHERGLFAPDVLAGPIPLGAGLATVEQFCDIGAVADAHDTAVRRALAASLYAIVEACEPLVASTSLKPSLLGDAGHTLWPKPHSRLFDFAATARGAEWIDEIAAKARDRMAPAGRRVIGHSDWRQEHVRFIGEKPVVAFDWDSLCCEYEPVLLGVAAHAFCADWSREGRRQAPTPDEARAFIADYEQARGAAFSAAERRVVGASFTYSCAYTARCVHAGGGDHRHIPGTFQHLLWSERSNLLDL